MSGRLSFYFQIVEIHERAGAQPRVGDRGSWVPPAGWDSEAEQPQTYYFDGNAANGVTQVASLPAGSQVYSTCSMYYDYGHFWAIDYDATQHAVDEDDRQDWHYIGFDHMNGMLSWVGIGGEQRRLGVQRDLFWARMLFPEHLYPSRFSTDERFGGLCGELPVLIALVAFSMAPAYTAYVLNLVMHGWSWNYHQHLPGRTDGRGLVVTVYLGPGTSSRNELRQFENLRIFPA